jgi:predicted HicB family RNase H-like nuclease
MENTESTEPVKTPEKRKHVHFDVPEQFHRRVKMMCAMKGTTIQAYVSTALEEKVGRDEAAMHGGTE